MITQETLKEKSNEINRIISLNELLNPDDDLERKLLVANLRKLRRLVNTLKRPQRLSVKLRLVK